MKLLGVLRFFIEVIVSGDNVLVGFLYKDRYVVFVVFVVVLVLVSEFVVCLCAVFGVGCFGVYYFICERVVWVVVNYVYVVVVFDVNNN